MKPNTNYTKSGQINIAYQVFGKGKIDLIYIPGWISNIDLMWSCPELVSFLESLGEKYRIILFDKRGTGLSDRMIEFSTIEERMDDIRVVMDAVDSDKAILFGHSEGGSVSALFAATYPNRTLGLITFGVFAKRTYSKDYPWAPTNEERQKVYDTIEKNWGSGEMNLETLAPSKANDSVFMDWLANYFRSGASPSAALVLTKMNTQVNIIDILPSIAVPSLIMQRTNDIDVKIEEGRFIADRIKGAVFKEFDGNDHLFWVGNTKEVLDEMFDFIKELQPKTNDDNQLLSIVSAEIIKQKGKQQNSLISIDMEQVDKHIIQKFRGTLHKNTNNSFLASFEGPSKAVNCIINFKNILNASNMSLRGGVHIGKCRIVNNSIDNGMTITETIGIKDLAKEDEVLVSQTIYNLLPKAEFDFKLMNISRNHTSFSEIYKIEELYSEQESISQPIKEGNSQNGLLLDRVLNSILENLSNTAFAVDNLCSDIGMSERQLQRKLKAISNKTPNQMIRSVRLHKAKEMIIQESIGIAQVAYLTGFSDASYFSKCFRKEFEMSPSDLVDYQ